MTLLWALVPTVLVLGVAVIGVLVHRLDQSVRGLHGRADALHDVRLATVVVEDDVAALRAAIAQTRRR